MLGKLGTLGAAQFLVSDHALFNAVANIESLQHIQLVYRMHELMPDAPLQPLISCKLRLKSLEMPKGLNPDHHQAFRTVALNETRYLSIYAVIFGGVQDDDIPGIVRYRTYEVLKEEVANPRLRWAYLPYSMHMAGPREAIQHMIIRKNYGGGPEDRCTGQIQLCPHASISVKSTASASSSRCLYGS